MGNGPKLGMKPICKKLLILGLAFALAATPLLSFNSIGEQDSAIPPMPKETSKDPPYHLNLHKIVANAAADGHMNETVWADPEVAKACTPLYGTFRLNISAFYNDTSAVFSVQLEGDDTDQPNDYCIICFDTDMSGGTSPTPLDVKLEAKNTKTADDASIYFGDGAGGWTLYSDLSGNPNPWPAGYGADAEIDGGKATYEFILPVEVVWRNGTWAGMRARAFAQGDNKHVSWPDWNYDGNNPPSDPCDDPSGYGDIIYNGQSDCNALMTYFDDGAASTPRNRTWNGTVWAGEYSATMIGADTNLWFDLEVCPTRLDEAILAASDDGDDLNIQTWNGSAWIKPIEIQNVAPDTAYKYFDVAYESNSGNAVLAYYNNTAGGNVPRYRIWNGTEWSGETAALAGNTAEINWVVLASKPNSNEILMATLDNNKGIYAQVWNGSAWGDGQIIETTASRNQYPCMDVTYEQQSEYGFVYWGGDAASNRNVHYRRWTGSWTEPAGNLAQAAGQVNIVKLASDPNTNHIIAGYLTQGNKIDVRVWGGSAWGTMMTVNSANTDRNDMGNFDLAWEATGSTEGLVAYDIKQQAPRYRTINGTVISATEQVALDANAGASNPPNWIILSSDPYSGDIMMMYLNDNGGGASDYIGAELWSGASNTWGHPQNVETLADRTYQCFDMVFLPKFTTPLVPDHLVYIAGDAQTGMVNATLPQKVQFQVVNQTNVAVPGATVNFTIYSSPVGSGPSFVESGTPSFNCSSDALGIAGATVRLGTKPGTYWINVSSPLPGLAGPTFNNSIDETATVGPLAGLEMTASPVTVAPTGISTLTTWANDSLGNGITGLTITMSFDANPSTPGESVSSPAIDNSDGTYTATYTAGSTGGVTDIVRATSGAIWDTVSIDITPNAPDHLVYVSGDGQSSAVDTAIAQPMKVRVVDSTGVNVPGITVNFTVYNWPAGATGYYFEESGQPWNNSVSDSQGIANATLHLGTKPGNYWVNASNPGLAGSTGPKFIDTLNATANAGALATLHTRPDPATVAPLGNSNIKVWANDSCGNGINGLTVSMSFDTNPSGGTVSPTAGGNGDGTYSASYTAGPSGGVTDVVNATSGGKWGNASIQVTALPLGSISISSNTGTVQVTGAATLTMWANDTGGGGMAGLTIALAFDSNPSVPGASLTAVSEIGGGVYSATYTAGQTAWVTDTVKASCSGKEDTVNISVQAGVPSDLVYVSGNGQQKNVSLALDAPFIAMAVDAYGNTVPGVPMAWAIVSYPAGATGQSIAPASNATDASGLSGARMTLGNIAGWFNASVTSASVPGDSVSFSAKALALPIVPQVYSIYMIGGDGQTGSVSSKLANPFIVEVRNQTGVPASGVNVWFNVTAGGGHTENGNATTGATGRAQTYLTLGPSAGLNTVTAEISSDGTPVVSFYAIGMAPEVSVALASNLTSIVAGGSMVFILTYDNTGTEPAKNVWLNFTKPTDLNYISDSSGVAPAAAQNKLSWLFPTSAVGPHSFVMLCRLGSQASDSFACRFDVNYSSQSGIRLPAVTSNTVTVDVLQEAGSNIPPIIDGVPDLIVHYDWDYGIDLAPYIFDPDNSEGELSLILSDNVNARVNSTWNLGIVLNYSHDLLGIPQLLNITVSDGLGSDWDVITITVSDDFPPEMVDYMPDVAFDEDTSCYGFNITHYFFDRDGDSLYYTYGQRHLNITILANYTVLFRGQQDWFGQERITFRALDPTGALIEDTILVTVRPVNDAPVAGTVPDQAGLVNVSWVLDLSPYISDVDNTMAQLTLTVDSDYATVNGLNITFRCAAPLNDILTVTVSDGAAQAYIQINVLVETPPVTPDSFPSWVLPPLIIILAIISLLLVLAARRKPVIEQAFLIYKDGALLAHTTNRMIPDMDSQIFSSMFTAIQDFIKDSFKDEKNWSLDKIEFGDNKIFVANGSEGLFSLALVYKGRDKGLRNISKKAIEAIDRNYGKELKDWDGNMDRFRGVRDLLSETIFK